MEFRSYLFNLLLHSLSSEHMPWDDIVAEYALDGPAPHNKVVCPTLPDLPTSPYYYRIGAGEYTTT